MTKVEIYKKKNEKKYNSKKNRLHQHNVLPLYIIINYKYRYKYRYSYRYRCKYILQPQLSLTNLFSFFFSLPCLNHLLISFGTYEYEKKSVTQQYLFSRMSFSPLISRTSWDTTVMGSTFLYLSSLFLHHIPKKKHFRYFSF